MSEWISVDDRVPDDHGMFLVCTSSGFITINGYSIDDGWHWDVEKPSLVTHWMPLPEPPEE